MDNLLWFDTKVGNLETDPKNYTQIWDNRQIFTYTLLTKVMNSHEVKNNSVKLKIKKK